MKRFLVHLEESQYETIRELAHQKRITMSEVIREAIDNYLEEGLGMKKQVNLADYNRFKEVDGYVWFTREDDPNENLILADDGYFLVDTSESDWQDWEDQWGFICENRDLWGPVQPVITVQEQLGAEVCTDPDGVEYFVTAAPETYTWRHKDRVKVMYWLDSLTPAGKAPNFPSFIFRYEEGTVLVNKELFDYDAVVNLMDDDLREELHLELAPCTNQEFVDAYVKRHAEKFGEEFTVN